MTREKGRTAFKIVTLCWASNAYGVPKWHIIKCMCCFFHGHPINCTIDQYWVWKKAVLNVTTFLSLFFLSLFLFYSFDNTLSHNLLKVQWNGGLIQVNCTNISLNLYCLTTSRCSFVYLFFISIETLFSFYSICFLNYCYFCPFISLPLSLSLFSL